MGRAIPLPERLSGVTVVLPVVTETVSLDETVRVLKETADESISEVLIIVCDRTTPVSRAHCEAAAGAFGRRAHIRAQRRPHLGGAMRDAFEWATSSHTLMMASDLETDPELAAPMIDLGRKHPGAIITASRWAPGGTFSGYGRTRVALNWAFQRMTSMLYSHPLTDATFGYRLFPTSVLKAITWSGTRHELLLETAIKPLRLGIELKEMPTQWHPRPDGESQNSLSTQARYVPTLWRTRFVRAESLLNGTPPGSDGTAPLERTR